MKSQNSVFIVFCLCLTLGLVTAFSVFSRYFGSGQNQEIRLTQLQKQIDKENFEKELLAYQLKDIQQSVASALPSNKKLQAQTDLKNFASALRKPASESELDMSGAMFERAKTYFTDKEFDKAISEFRKLTEQYPFSQHNVESRFFMAECYFVKKDYKSSLSLIDEMVSLYPDNELTGFILLRMGQISEINNQYEEASEVYRTVQKNFKNDKLKAQAKQLAKNLEY